ncbi:MAG TPA: serine/threonine-protein kinase [Kofleriaceae bacterium]|nr:serine/threonine-protein kinase [Kofleriaceae bacterium]
MSVDPSAETEAERPGAKVGAAPLAAGATLGKYRLERVLGAGGMGVVWAALDPDLERAVAIKVLRTSDGGEIQRTRLLREARAMARLKHPNVLTVYEVGTASGVDYIAMELVDGDNLGAWFSRPQPREEVIAVLLAAGRGLAAAHEAGIVHRDFKPENVLRDLKGHVYVTDFGLAFGQVEETAELVPLAVPALSASGSGRRSLDSVLDSPLTQTGVLIGTPAYMAPEQFAGRAAGPRSDQFGYCVTVWEALTGTRPFRGKDLIELQGAAAAGISRLEGQVSPAVHAVLARGLAADPDARWPDMPALLAELERALQPAPLATRRRIPRLALAIALGAAVVVAGVIAFAVTRGPHGVPSAGGACEPANAAFANAWGPAKRAELSKTHPGMGSLAAFAVLDDTRNRWIRAYDAACAAPASADRHERLACLFEVRDEVASTTAELAHDDGDLNIMEVVGLATGVEGCGRN